MSTLHPTDLLLLTPLLLLLLHCPSSEQLNQLRTDTTISAVDLSALHQIKNSLTDIPYSRRTPESSFFSTWDFSSPDPCSSFAGVTCSGNRVTILTLGTGLSDSPGLAGSLSPSISRLTELTQLVLFAGIVTGPIPPQLGSLLNLRVISLTNNRLTGPLPGSIPNLANLHTLDLSHNWLSGSVPRGISGLPQLKVLVLASNGFSGDPPELPDQLLHFDISNNGFSGKLPNRMPSKLRYLSASGNEMWGPLNGLESLPELVYLDLSVNNFSGPVPSSLFRATLPSMLLQRNNLSGPVPPLSTSSSQPYGPGSIVDLSHNALTGVLSTTLAGVETLFLNSNQLTGTVPGEYLRSVCVGSTKTLYLQHNYLTGLMLGPGHGPDLPDSASVCLSYNCMVPPRVGLMACPASAGNQLSRPVHQCSAFNNGSSMG